jgi:hypothetical protein
MAAISLTQIVSIIGGLIGVVNSVSGAHNGNNTSQVVDTISQLATVAQNLKNPTDVPSALADLDAMLAAVKVAFPNAGAAVDNIAVEITKFDAVVKNAVSGQFVVVDDNLTIPGIPGVYEAFVVNKASTVDSVVAWRTSQGL